MDYSNSKVIITGGSRGIGLALAEEFVRLGAGITIAARDETRIAKAVESIQACRVDTSQKVTGIPLDVTRMEDVQKKLGEWVVENGAPEILVNCAGFAHPGQVEDLAIDIFKRTMDVNYFGTVNCVKAVLPAMLARGSGIIVNISSVGGFLGIYGYTAYSGSKFAVTGFSDALRNELKPRGIRVSVVFPPDTDTEQLAYESQFKPEVTRKIAGNAGLQTPQQVARGIISGLNKRQYVITPGFEPTVIYWLHHFMGKLTFNIVDWMAVNAWKEVNRRNTTSN
ncbi:MAG: SDR family oxidoreductase [Leptolinea sp.]|jgi:3-dehydrosphinganine reductase|nr:SDR family oxidoreductase [Leptolinea sp.]